MASREDDALSWDGDDDPTLDPSGDATTPDEQADGDGSTLPKGWRAVGRGHERVRSADDEADGVGADTAAPPLGSVALVTLGVMGGILLLWTIGWYLGATRLRERIEQSTDAVADFMFQGSMVLAIAAPLLWFVVTWLGTRRVAQWKRFAWLAAGIVLLVPWPFVMVGVVGQ